VAKKSCKAVRLDEKTKILNNLRSAICAEKAKILNNLRSAICAAAVGLTLR
jgi:hypothetical protein